MGEEGTAFQERKQLMQRPEAGGGWLTRGRGSWGQNMLGLVAPIRNFGSATGVIRNKEKEGLVCIFGVGWIMVKGTGERVWVGRPGCRECHRRFRREGGSFGPDLSLAHVKDPYKTYRPFLPRKNAHTYLQD